MEPTEAQKEPIIIGYWDLRLRAQVIRLCCQHFKIKYTDKIYGKACDWVGDQNCQKMKQWPFIELPYLIDGDVHLSGSIPCIEYLAKTYGPRDFLGRTLEDETHIDMFLWSFDSLFKDMSALGCPKTCPEEFMKAKEKFWKEHVLPKIQYYETFCKINDWFFGYLTVCDFVIYEVMPYMQKFFPKAAENCKKLRALAIRVSELETISEYESSCRTIKNRLPMEVFSEQRKECHKQP